MVKSVSARASAGAGSREPSGVNSLQHLEKWGTAGDLSRRILAGGNPKCSNHRGGGFRWLSNFKTAGQPGVQLPGFALFRPLPGAFPNPANPESGYPHSSALLVAATLAVVDSGSCRGSFLSPDRSARQFGKFSLEKPGEKKAAKLRAQGWLRKVQLTVFAVLAALSLVVAGTLAFYPANWQQIAKERAVQLRPELASASSSKSKKQESKDKDSRAKEAGAPKGMKPVAKKVPRNLDTTGWQIDPETGSCNADVLIIGDSVTLGASADIKKVLPQAAVDGAISRQIQSGRRYLPTTTTRGFILASWYMPWEPMRRCAVIYWHKT